MIRRVRIHYLFDTQIVGLIDSQKSALYYVKLGKGMLEREGICNYMV